MPPQIMTFICIKSLYNNLDYLYGNQETGKVSFYQNYCLSHIATTDFISDCCRRSMSPNRYKDCK